MARSKLAIAGVVVGGFALAFVIGLFAADVLINRGPPHRQALRARPASGIAPALAAAIPTLTGASTPAPIPPPREIVKLYALQPRLARQVDPQPNLAVWIIPGSRGACLEARVAQQPEEIHCMATATVLTGHLVADYENVRSNLGEPIPDVLLGLAPAHNLTVKAASADGITLSVPVIDNIYALTGIRVGLVRSVTLLSSVGRKQAIIVHG